MQKTLSRETIASVLVFVSFAVGAVETPPQIFKPGSPKLRTSLRAVMPAIPDAKWTKGWFAVDDAVYAELGLGAKDIDSIYRTALQRYLFGGDNTKRVIPTPDGTKQA